MAICGFALAGFALADETPEERQAHLQHWIADDIEHHRVAPHDASTLEHELDKLNAHVTDERRKHHGRLTDHEWEGLNKEMDKLEAHVHEAERVAPPHDHDR